MCRVYGYARISTNKQNIERQERNIKAAYPDAVIIRETFTGTKTEGRVKFVKLMRTVKAGDTVVFDSVSRMSRDAEEGFALYKDCFSRGIDLVFLKEQQISTSTYKQEIERKFGEVSTGDADADKMVNTIMQALTDYTLALAERQIKIAFEQAEKEVADLHQRTKEGIETARLNGKQIGQQLGRKLNVKKAGEAKRVIKQYSKTFGGTMPDDQLLKLAGISRPTLYKYKKELKHEQELHMLTGES